MCPIPLESSQKELSNDVWHTCKQIPHFEQNGKMKEKVRNLEIAKIKNRWKIMLKVKILNFIIYKIRSKIENYLLGAFQNTFQALKCWNSRTHIFACFLKVIQKINTFLAFWAFSGISVQSNVDFINFTPIFISLNLQALLKTMKVINFVGYGKTVIVLHAPINKTTVQC